MHSISRKAIRVSSTTWLCYITYNKSVGTSGGQPFVLRKGNFSVKVAKFLFVAYLAVLVFCLGTLLLVSPYLAFWHLDATSVATFQFLLHRSAEIQILLGSALMLLFGFLYVGPMKTLTFFVISLPVSLLMRTFLTGKTSLLGLYPANTAPASQESGLEVFFILLSWFSMSFSSYLLASKLVARLGLRRQTLWSLLLGTYFLVAWSVALDAVLTGARLPAQTSLWHDYGSSFGLPVYNLVNWAVAGLLLLMLSRLWFPLMLSTCLVLVPESLAYFPREEPHPIHGGRFRTSLSQLVWLIMRVGVWGFGRRRLQLVARGVEHIPRSGPVLIVANHVHYFFDGYILIRTVPRRLHTLVALDWVQVQALRLVIELACSLADWPVVLRSEQLRERDTSQNWAYKPLESRQYLRQVISNTVRLLRASEALAIFPEAYPAFDPHPTLKHAPDEFLPFRPGFIKLVELAERDHRTRVAIVPAGLMYTSTGKGWQATVQYGQALFLSDFASHEEALHTVEERVQALSLALSSVTPLPPGETFPL